MQPHAIITPLKAIRMLLDGSGVLVRVERWKEITVDAAEGYLWKQRAQTGADRIKELERLLSRAYPWLHNPYHGTTDYANEAEGDAVIKAVEFAIRHVPDEPDPLLALPCASCDGDGCPNCAMAAILKEDERRPRQAAHDAPVEG